MSNICALTMQDRILSIVNSNDAEGVVYVNNYMGEQVLIDDAEFEVVYENGVLVEIAIKTDLKYSPTQGEYVDYTVTLTNELELLINDKFSKAEDYEAPKKADANMLGIGGLDYIL